MRGALFAQTGPATFNTAEEARDALIRAADQGPDAVRALFGPGSAEILRTGDAVEDKQVLLRFKQLAAEKAVLEADPVNPDRMRLLIGTIEWPMAVPLVRKGGRWSFDIQEGKAEIRRRTIGGNELDTIEICRGYVEAQQTYTETDWDGNGVLEYAKKIISSEGKKDGLYWPGGGSPVAAGFAKAVAQGYTASTGGARQPYHGYLYKVLMAQGPEAAGRRAGLCGPRPDDRGLRAGGVARGIWRLRHQDIHRESGWDHIRERPWFGDQRRRHSNDPI